MESPQARLQAVIGQLIDTKVDKPNYIGGILGTYDSLGNQIVNVENRENFVYVRVNGNFSEVVEAFNDTVAPNFDLKVLLIKEENNQYYRVYGRDLGQYQTWGANGYLQPHGWTHSFGGGNYDGSDPTFIWKKQILQPLGVRPTNTGGNFRCWVEGDFYIWNSAVRYFDSRESADLTALLPTAGSRYVTIYLDAPNNRLGYVTGDVFNTYFYSTGSFDAIPNVAIGQGYPLAAVLLTSQLTEIGYDDILDIRNFLNSGITPTGSYFNIYDNNAFKGTVQNLVFNSGISVIITGNFAYIQLASGP